MTDEEIKLTDANRPHCPVCSIGMQCPDCDDLRPTADDLYNGWRLRTPLNRYEIVTKVHRPKYGKIWIWTDKSGTYAWRYRRDDHVTATRPDSMASGNPEVRYIEGYGRDSMMWICATQDNYPGPSLGHTADLARAQYSPEDRCWYVTHDFDTVEDQAASDRYAVIIKAESKAKARTELKRLGREYAKELGVPFRVPTTR